MLTKGLEDRSGAGRCGRGICVGKVTGRNALCISQQGSSRTAPLPGHPQAALGSLPLCSSLSRSALSISAEEVASGAGADPPL